MTLPVDLLNISNHLYRRTEYWWIVSVVISVGALSLALVGLWIGTSVWISLGGLFALVAPVGIAWSREAASVSMLRANKCRRLILFANGLDHAVSAQDLVTVRAWTVRIRLEEAPFVRPYYSSQKAPGAQRLADIVAESAFFTEQLAAKMQVCLWVSCGVALMVAAIGLYSADLASIVTERGTLLFAKSAAILVSFLLAGDLFLNAKKYGDLRHEAHETFTRCVYLRGDPKTKADEVRTVVEDYSDALLQAPPIPRKLYGWYRDDLNRIYRDSHGDGK